jgi:Spy/CpxP family protein refolding chaperone
MKLKVLVGVLIILIAINLATIGSYLYTLRKHGDRHLPEPPMPFVSHPARPDGSHLERPGWTLMRGLSREERAQLKQLLSDLRMETEDLRNVIHSMEAAVMDALRQDSIPSEQVDSLLEEIAAAHLQVSRKATDKLIEAKSYLSPEQQALFYDAILQAHSHGYGEPGRKGMFQNGRKRPRQQGRKYGR